MNQLYPAIEPYKTHLLPVDEIHALYIEECGNPAGVPVCFLHGGPGSGCEAYHRQFFDPEFYRVILFDQRGCGRSKPHAVLINNTTNHLLNDMEMIREYLNIEQWMLFGGSWGSTLSLLYAQSYPEKVTALIVRGIFMCRDSEIEWFYQQGASRIYPEFWQDYLKPVHERDRDEMVKAYYRLLTCGDRDTELNAAQAWSTWEGRAATMKPNPSVIEHFTDAESALAIARIECHYFINKAFIEPDQILNNARTLNSIPGTIVHGRYDMICPVENAVELSKVWNCAELKVIEDAGHAAAEPSIQKALIEATEKYKGLFL